MKQCGCNFALTPKTDAGGRVTIKASNLPMGLMVFLMGLLCAGISIAASGWHGDSPQRTDPDQEPFRSANSLYGKNIEDIDVTQFGFDPDPAPATPVAKDGAGPSEGRAAGSFLWQHALTVLWIVAAFVGIRIMFTGVKVSFDTQHALVRWQEKSLWGAHSAQHPLSQVNLLLHETVVRSRRTLDWHGFAASLVNSDSGAIQLARSETIEGVKDYADNFQKLTGIEATQIGAKQANSQRLYMRRPFSLKQ